MQQRPTLYAASWIVLGAIFVQLTVALGFVTRLWATQGNPWGVVWIALAAGVFAIGSIALREVLAAGSTPAPSRRTAAHRSYAR
jgi:hypothetical protein